MDDKTGTFLVAHADDESAVLRAVADGQVHTLASNPGLDAGEVIEATVAPNPPIEAIWELRDLNERRSIAVERSEEPPTRRAVELADEQSVGEITRRERAGTGEVHVLTVPPERTGAVAAEVLDDEETLARAARYGVDRVEIRAADDVVSVRYLP